MNAVAIAAVALGLVSQLPVAPWPQHRHDSRNTGRSTYTGPKTPVEKWVRDDGPYYSLVVDRYGRVLSSLGSELFDAFDREGNYLWGVEGFGTSPTMSPDGIIYTRNDYIYALTSDRKFMWKSHTIPGMYFSTLPRFGHDGSLVLVLWDSGFSHSSYVVSVDTEGKQRWATKFDEEVGGPAIGLDGTIFVSSTDSAVLHVIDPKNGNVKSSFTIPNSRSIETPIIGDDGSLICATDRGLFVLGTDGSVKGELMDGHDVYHPSLGTDGTIVFYVTERNGENVTEIVTAAYPDGTIKWQYPFTMWREDDRLSGPPVIDGEGTVYVAETAVGRTPVYLYAISSEGDLKWKYPFFKYISSSRTVLTVNPPVIGDCNMLYVVVGVDSPSGYIYALGEEGDGGMADCGYPYPDGGEGQDAGSDAGVEDIGSTDVAPAADAGAGADTGVRDARYSTDSAADVVVYPPGCGCSMVQL